MHGTRQLHNTRIPQHVEACLFMDFTAVGEVVLPFEQEAVKKFPLCSQVTLLL